MQGRTIVVPLLHHRWVTAKTFGRESQALSTRNKGLRSDVATVADDSFEGSLPHQQAYIVARKPFESAWRARLFVQFAIAGIFE